MVISTPTTPFTSLHRSYTFTKFSLYLSYLLYVVQQIVSAYSSYFHILSSNHSCHSSLEMDNCNNADARQLWNWLFLILTYTRLVKCPVSSTHYFFWPACTNDENRSYYSLIDHRCVSIYFLIPPQPLQISNIPNKIVVWYHKTCAQVDYTN